MQLQRITSRSNQHVKHARSVRDGISENEIFIEGMRSVREAVAASIEPIAVYADRQFIERSESIDLIRTLAQRTTNIYEVEHDVITSISDTRTPQGIVMIAARPGPAEVMIKRRMSRSEATLPIAVYLVGVNNPANLGAVARAAEAAGAVGLIVSPESADAFSPKAIRGSMGSLFRLPVWPDASFGEVSNWCSDAGLVLSGTSLGQAKSYLDVDWNVGRVLVFGSEGHGLHSEYEREFNETLKIPMEPAVESLNLAVSCAVMLFEARRSISSRSGQG